jgi:hypothetical protein
MTDDAAVGVIVISGVLMLTGLALEFFYITAIGLAMLTVLAFGYLAIALVAGFGLLVSSNTDGVSSNGGGE